jgi:hypothetical protein
VPNRSSVAVGMERIGPIPQMTRDAFIGERKVEN